MGNRRGHRSNWWTETTNGIANWLGVAIVGVLVVASAVTIGAIGQRTQPASTVAYTPAPLEITSTPTPTPTVARIAFADAWGRVQDNGRPFVIAVVGDSTANDEDEWANLAFQQLAQDLNRPLVHHVWDLATNSYVDNYDGNDDGSNAPLIVWNGSAPGMDGAYSLANIAAMIPEAPDAIFLNHGHNAFPTPTTLVDQLDQLRDSLTTTYPEAGLASVIQNPRLDDRAEAFEAALATERQWLTEHPEILAIDVNAAYKSAGNLASLLNSDRLHPSPAGSEVAAEAVLAALPSPN